MICIFKEVKRGKEFLTQRSAEGSAKERGEEKLEGDCFFRQTMGEERREEKEFVRD
jgi:hypothetical protein